LLLVKKIHESYELRQAGLHHTVYALQKNKLVLTTDWPLLEWWWLWEVYWDKLHKAAERSSCQFILQPQYTPWQPVCEEIT